MAVDHYTTLGVPPTAEDKDIKSAYRQAARKWHPDVNPSDEAKTKFQGINEAYSVLSDKNLRKMYDQFGEAGVKGQASSSRSYTDFDMEDFFSPFDGHRTWRGRWGNTGRRRRRSDPAKGDDLACELEIDLHTALFGGDFLERIEHLETCTVCTGSGVAPGSKVSQCGQCGGRGVVDQVVGTMRGPMHQRAHCPSCGGSGEVIEQPCSACDGRGKSKQPRQVTIRVPPGVEHENRIRVPGEGDAGARGAPPGDLFVFVHIRPDPRFRRDGMDIHSDVSLSCVDAALGARVSVPTVDGETIELEVPPGTQPGTVLRINGRGAPQLHYPNNRGIHHVHLQVEVPRGLSEEEEELFVRLREIAEERQDDGAERERASVQR